MAIDTAAKRRSASGIPFLPLGPGVIPDASKPVAWRQQAGWGYSGIVARAALTVIESLVCASINVMAALRGSADSSPALDATPQLREC